jgi:hypothetical protein
MKLTRQQLRRLIEASVRKDGDYTIPVEDPVTDPLKDLDYSDEQKEKIKMLALSDDPQTRVQADLFADMGDLKNDPDEFNDLGKSEKHSKIREEMKELLLKRIIDRKNRVAATDEFVTKERDYTKDDGIMIGVW